MFFSIIVVCYNAGEKLQKTIESIRAQTETDYEIVVKDGLSIDGSVERLSPGKNMKIIKKRDKGIYDAMNQAIAHASGKYIFFLNCGDFFGDRNVLSRVKRYIEIERNGEVSTQGGAEKKIVPFRRNGEKIAPKAGESAPGRAAIYYGNILERATGACVMSNPNIDDFACFRNVPCHQACFYDRGLFGAGPRKSRSGEAKLAADNVEYAAGKAKYEAGKAGSVVGKAGVEEKDAPSAGPGRGFCTGYKVRADYEHFLWCYYKARAAFVYMPLTVASYEGGGFSETKENKKRSAAEHRHIVRKYMSAGQILKYRLLLLLTLSPVRTYLAENPITAGAYQTVKTKLYDGKFKKT